MSAFILGWYKIKDDFFLYISLFNKKIYKTTFKIFYYSIIKQIILGYFPSLHQ